MALNIAFETRATNIGFLYLENHTQGFHNCKIFFTELNPLNVTPESKQIDKQKKTTMCNY